MRPAAGQSRRSLALAGQRRWKNNFPPPLALGSRAEQSGRPGMGYRQRWKAGTALVPAVVAAQRLLKPLRLSGPAHRARIVTCPAAPAGTPTSGHSACPQPAPGLREWQSSWSGEKCLSSPSGSWRKGLFLHSGFCCSGFSAASRAAVAVPSGWRQRAPKKTKSKLRLEGWAAIAGSGECGIWFLCLYGLTAFFFSFIMGGFFGNPGLSLDLGNALQNQTPQPLRAFPAWDHGSSADQENAQPKTKRRQMLGLA